MRKALEQELLAECLKGRVSYRCSALVGMDSCRLFELYVDHHLVKQCSHETVNSYLIAHGFKQNHTPHGLAEYWESYWSLLDQVPYSDRTEYTDEEFCEALKCYRNQPIEDRVLSQHPIVRMFSLLDRRVGKRTLASLRDKMLNQPQWLQNLYTIRLNAESDRSRLFPPLLA